MVKKVNRVCHNQEFSSIIHHRHYVKNDAFVAYRQKRVQPYARIGISVSKKLGNAVVRNKIKRQVRMMIDALYTFEEDYDTILIVRNGYHRANFAENKDKLADLKKRLDQSRKGTRHD